MDHLGLLAFRVCMDTLHLSYTPLSPKMSTHVVYFSYNMEKFSPNVKEGQKLP